MDIKKLTHSSLLRKILHILFDHLLTPLIYLTILLIILYTHMPVRTYIQVCTTSMPTHIYTDMLASTYIFTMCVCIHSDINMLAPTHIYIFASKYAHQREKELIVSKNYLIYWDGSVV